MKVNDYRLLTEIYGQSIWFSSEEKYSKKMKQQIMKKA